MSEEQNPFDCLDEVAAVYAFVHSQLGEAGLRELLSLVDHDHESLLRDAALLSELGLLKAADLVTEAATSAPEAGDLNPFDESIDACNHRDWNRRHRGVFEGFQITEDTDVR